MRSAVDRYGWLMGALVGLSIGVALPNLLCMSPRDMFRHRSLTEYGEGEEYTSKDEEEEENPELSYAVNACVVLILISLTIGFELMKEHSEESASRNMKPIIESLFGEMTVLGFLSAFTFFVTKAGSFEKFGVILFGEAHAEELLETFENAHFTIFFIMIFFVVQVLVLIQEAGESEQDWLEMDRKARDPDVNWAERAQLYQQHQQQSFLQSYTSLLFRNKAVEKQEDLLLFKALRDEFVLDRDLDYPFRPSEQLVDETFNFGRYLSACMGSLMTQVVEVTIKAWLFFAVATVMYYGYALLVHENETTLSWTWVVVAWIVFFYNIHFERHLVMLISAFASKELYYMSGQEEPNSESTNLVEGANSGSSLPGWCHVDIERYKQSRPLWRRYLVGGIPNRQEALYWMDRKGPPLYRFILQVGLLFVGVYAAFQFLHCGPIMYQTLPLGFFILYVILATLPALFIIRNKKHLIATLTPVCCLGVYRRPQVIANVIREEKTARAVRAFIVVFKLRRFAMQAACAKLKKLSIHYNDYFDKFEVSEVGQTFDEFDVDGTGTITPDEFQQVMERMGASLTHDQLSNLIQNLDKDCSGGVSREEFIQWYADHCHEDNLDEHELATFMFKAFDTDNDGEISVSEFKKRLESRTTQFTLDEVGGLVNELDENNCGKVCIEEFEHLLHKYYPKELKKSNQHSSWHHN